MKSRTQQWMVLAVILVLLGLWSRQPREHLCPKPASAVAVELKAECDAAGGTVVNGQCSCTG